MDRKNEHFRNTLLFYFSKSKKASEVHKDLCEVYRDKCITKRVCQNFLKKLRFEKFSLKDDQRSGPSTKVDNDHFKVRIKPDRQTLKVSQRKIEKIHAGDTVTKQSQK